MFSYSDQDEVGTTVAEIEVGGRLFTIYNVHPDGSETAMLTFAQTLLAQSKDQPNCDCAGGLQLARLRRSLPADRQRIHQRLDQRLPDRDQPGWCGHVWREPHRPHILLANLQVRNPVYVLPPESATDHPVHWAEIFWK